MKIKILSTIILFIAAVLFVACPVPDEETGKETEGDDNYIISDAKSLSSFRIKTPAAQGIIDEDSKEIHVNISGTTADSLIAVFYSTGASVKVNSVEQVSGITVNDFTNPVEYIVTAEDGSTVVYTVTVTILSDAKAITEYGFETTGSIGVIDEFYKKINVDVITTGSAAALIASFETTGVSVKVDGVEQESGVTPNDFTDPVDYTVTAEDGSTAVYRVIVNIIDPTRKAITSFKLNSPPSMGIIDESAKTINLAVPYDTSMPLTAVFTTTGNSVTVDGVEQESGVTTNDFTGPVVYRVTALDSTTADYTVTVTPDPSNISRIDSGTFPGIAIGSDNKVYISYNDDAEYITTAALSGGSWTFKSIEYTGSVFIKDSHLAVDSSGDVHASYSISGYGLKYAIYSGGSWISSQLESSNVLVGSDLAIDSQNKSHIVYFSLSAGLKYTTDQSGTWIDETIAPDTGLYFAIAVDSADNIHVCYYDNAAHTLNYISKDSGASSWNPVITIDSNYGVGTWASIAADHSDKIHISYYDDTDRDLKYATNAGGSWENFTVDSSGDVGRATCIAVDSSDKVHISYYDASNKDLKYATNSSGGWISTTIDAIGNTGSETGICVGPDDKKHIAYHDLTNMLVKYAVIE